MTNSWIWRFKKVIKMWDSFSFYLFLSICPHSPVTLSSSLTSNFLCADFSLLSRSLHVANFCSSKFSSPKRKCLSTALPQMKFHYDYLSSPKLDVISLQCILFAPILWQCHMWSYYLPFPPIPILLQCLNEGLMSHCIGNSSRILIDLNRSVV